MNRGILVHVSANSLGKMARKTFVFENLDGFSFFDYAVNSLLRSKLVDLLIFICPGKDEECIREKLKKFGGLGRITIKGIGETEKGKFEKSNCFFDPLMMMTRDLFGVWNPFVWEQVTSETGLRQMLVFNLESFWFLSSKVFDSLILKICENEKGFYVQGTTPDDWLIGLDYGAAKQVLGKLKNDIKKRISLIHGNFYSDCKQEDFRFKRIERMLGTISMLNVARSFDKFTITEENGSLNGSLRHQLGIAAMLKPSWQIQSQSSMKQVIPQVIRVELVSESTGTLDLFQLKEAVSFWNEIPFWILEYSQGFDFKILLEMLRLLAKEISGKIYVECPSFWLKPSDLKKVYENGGDVWILKWDDWKNAFDNNMVSTMPNDWVKQAINRDDLPDKFLMLKRKNNMTDMDEIRKWVNEWQYFVDGLVISPDFENHAFKAKTFGVGCSKVPLEVKLCADGMLSLCTVLKGFLPVNDYPAWNQAILQAGNMEQCFDCREKFLYGRKHEWGVRNSFKKLTDYRFSFLQKRHEKAEFFMEQKLWEEALDALEDVLRYNPVSEDVWNKIGIIEKEILKDHH